MDRDSSTRPARFRQAAAERGIYRGSRKGGCKSWQKCLVAGANGVVGRLLRDSIILEELFGHSAGYSENSGRCLQLATGSNAEGIFPNRRGSAAPRNRKSRSHNPHGTSPTSVDRRSIHASETVDADVVLDRADPDPGKAISRTNMES